MHTRVEENWVNQSQNIRNPIWAIPENTYQVTPLALLEALYDNNLSDAGLPHVMKTNIPEPTPQQDDWWHGHLSGNFDGSQNMADQVPALPSLLFYSMILEAEVTNSFSFHWSSSLDSPFTITESMADYICASFIGDELS